jgi:NAD-dependent DNA ligase
MNYKNYLNGTEIPTENTLSNLVREARKHYYDSGQEIMSDSDYDALEELLRRLYPTNQLLIKTGSETRGGKIPLAVPMFGLEQLTENQIDNWINRHKLTNNNFVSMQKLDGLSIQMVFENNKLKIAYSRGNGLEGADITRHVKHILKDKNYLDGIVRAEVIVSKENFEKIIDKRKEQNLSLYENPRAFVAGQMNSKTSDNEFYSAAEIVAYQIFNTLDSKENQLIELSKYFSIPDYKVIDKIDIEQLKEQIVSYKSNSFETDGLVVWVNETEFFNKLGNLNSGRPYGAFKFKVNSLENMVTTTVTDVIYRVTRYGELAPRIQFEPVFCDGVTVTWATGYNGKYIKDNDIGPGTEVLIARSGNVIPNIIEVKKSTIAKLPDESLNWSWDKNQVQIVADLNHPYVVEEMKKFQLLNTLVVLNIEGAKDAAVDNLIENNIFDIFQLLDLTKEQLQSFIGNSAGNQLYDDLRIKLTNAELNQLGSASNCFGKGIGQRKLKKILDQYNRLDNLTVDDIVKIDGYSDKSAHIFINGQEYFSNWLSKLKTKINIKTQEAKKIIMSDRSVVFTGFRDKELEQILEEQGWKISSSVSKKTTVVVCDDKNSGSSKIKKAEELGVEVFLVDEFKEQYLR